MDSALPQQTQYWKDFFVRSSKLIVSWLFANSKGSLGREPFGWRLMSFGKSVG
jgi:hypothetical protein